MTEIEIPFEGFLPEIALITKKAYTIIIMGTAEQILQTLIDYHYPVPVSFDYDIDSGMYHVIAIDNPNGFY
jgi:hypothetical protein